MQKEQAEREPHQSLQVLKKLPMQREALLVHLPKLQIEMVLPPSATSSYHIPPSLSRHQPPVQWKVKFREAHEVQQSPRCGAE